MSKTTILYVSMIFVFVVGLWVTLHLGRSLKAPHDFAGRWVQADDAPNAGPKSLAIAQSGRFLRLRADDRPSVDLRLTVDRPVESGRHMTFVGGAQQMTVETANSAFSADGVYRFSLQGPISGVIAARREPADAASLAARKH